MNHFKKTFHPSVDNYLKQLEQELNFMPRPEQEQHVAEISDHLVLLVQEKEAQGLSVNKAVDDTLREFLPAKVVAERLAEEYNQKNKEKFGLDYRFTIGCGFLFGGFGLLAVSIFKGYIEWGSITVGILGIMITLIYLFRPNTSWNGERLETLRKFGRSVIQVVVPLGAFSFILRSIIEHELHFFSFVCAIVYVILALAIYSLFKRLYEKKRNLL